VEKKEGRHDVLAKEVAILKKEKPEGENLN